MKSPDFDYEHETEAAQEPRVLVDMPKEDTPVKYKALEVFGAIFIFLCGISLTLMFSNLFNHILSLIPNIPDLWPLPMIANLALVVGVLFIIYSAFTTPFKQENENLKEYIRELKEQIKTIEKQ